MLASLAWMEEVRLQLQVSRIAVAVMLTCNFHGYANVQSSGVVRRSRANWQLQ